MRQRKQNWKKAENKYQYKNKKNVMVASGLEFKNIGGRVCSEVLSNSPPHQTGALRGGSCGSIIGIDLLFVCVHMNVFWLP